MKSSTNRKRIREVYFYKTESGEYKIDLIDGKDNIVKEQLYYSNRVEVNNFIESIQNNVDKKYESSSLGLKIYNKKPEQRLLTKTTESIFDSYVNNLLDLKEDTFYRHKVAALLRNVSDILDGDAPKDTECGCDDMEFPVGVEPESPISEEVPIDLLSRLQDSLQTTVHLNDCTFWFQDQRWQITKDIYDYETPEPQKPKTSHNIRGTMDYIALLLGVNAEMNTNIGENSLRFDHAGEVYKIKHIYTGDHNTIRRS